MHQGAGLYRATQTAMHQGAGLYRATQTAMHQGAGPPAPVRRPATVDGMDNPSAGPTRIVTKTYAIVLLHEERGDSPCRCPPYAAATRRGRPCRSAWTWPGRPSGCAWPPCGGMGSRCRKTSASSPWIWATSWTPWCSEWPCPWGRKRRLSRLPVANGRQVMRALHSDYAGYWQTPAHVASPPQPPSPLRPQTPAGDGRRGENGNTWTVPDAKMAKYGSRAFVHHVRLQRAGFVLEDVRDAGMPVNAFRDLLR